MRPSTTQGRNQSISQLLSSLEQFARPFQRRAFSQQRSRQPNPSLNYSYDPTIPIFDRLYPQQNVDPKLAFLKLKERALKRRKHTLRKEEEAPKFIPINFKTEQSRFEPIKQQKQGLYQTNAPRENYMLNSLNMLKQMQKDKEKLKDCNFKLYYYA